MPKEKQTSFIHSILKKNKKKKRTESIGSASSSQRGSLDAGVHNTPSHKQRVREAAIIQHDLGISISENTDLLEPMKLVCDLVKKVLEVAKVTCLFICPVFS